MTNANDQCRTGLRVIAIVVALGAASLLAQAPAPPTRDISDAAVTRAVAARVAELGAAGTFSGVVIAARGTEHIAVATAGYADRIRKTRVTPSTRFTIGSMGKTHLYIVLDSRYTVVSLANQDPPAAETGAELARALLIEKAARAM